MKYIAGSSVSLIFMVLGTIHVYWAMGGSKWVKYVIPQTRVGGEQTLSAPSGITFIVAGGLFALAILCGSILYHHHHHQVLPAFLRFVGWGIAALFSLRAIGEFHYVGFFKKVQGTPFAIHDTLYFSPLCVLIAVLMVVLVKGW